jgi:two-component system NtrC family sensor kinase
MSRATKKKSAASREDELRVARRSAQLFALSGVAQAITESESVELLLARVLEIVLQATALDAASAHLFDDEDESLNLAVHRNLNARAVRLMQRYELGEGVVGRAAVLGETLIVTDAAQDERLARRDVVDENIGALIAVPMLGRSGVRGVLSLFHHAPRGFSEYEQSMLAAIGRQTGLALEHARLFEDVNSARREWERTFDALTDGVSIHAPSGRIRRANASLAALFGTTPSALVGVRCCELYHNSPKPRHNCTIMRTVTERAGQTVELRDRIYGRVLRVTTDPIIAADGRITGVVCMTRDVTDEKLIERRLIQQERISAIGEIAAGIAHEVGTPLNIISANIAYLLRDEKLARANRDELEAIREQTGNIAALVRQLLDFARDASPQIAPVNINDLIARTVNLLAHQLNHSGIECALNLAPYIPIVDGDAAQLQQVFFNLINNARQAMERIDDETAATKNNSARRQSATNSRRKILTITTDSALMPTEIFNHPHVVITIGDTGRGIPPEALPHVFKPFFTANKEGGTGLGLAISHRIVQRHSGMLTIERSDESGTLVRLRLPLAQN